MVFRKFISNANDKNKCKNKQTNLFKFGNIRNL